ncbi:MAG: proline--tRNA ligase [bacterium]
MKKLTDINQDFAQWYQDVLMESEVIDNSPTRGSYVLRPYGYAVWENIKEILDKKIKKHGTQNAYLPLLIPESFLKKEAKHVEGFAPEVAVVTHAGGKPLEEVYVIRPTSETIMYYMFAKWIKSWRDLPLQINQWCNIVRWEMRTRPFLRTCEILWQEGHTAHRTQEEAVTMATTMLEEYRDLAENYLAIPVVLGEKTESERFAGASATYCFEGLMQDGKALQMGTSHVLAHSFPAAFDVQFQDQDGTTQTPWCTSWGVSTRLIGAVILTHGDQNGLIMPPRIAPIQVVIVPIYRSDDQKDSVLKKVEEIKTLLEKQNVRVHVDADDQKTPGAKFFHWEVRGVPVRMEVGPKDIENNQVVLVNRVEPDKNKKKIFVSFDTMAESLQKLLDSIQTMLFEQAKKRRDAQWFQADKLSDFGAKLEKDNGMYQVGWCGGAACEETLKEFKGTIRCIVGDHKHKICFACQKASIGDVLVAKAY